MPGNYSWMPCAPQEVKVFDDEIRFIEYAGSLNANLFQNHPFHF